MVSWPGCVGLASAIDEHRGNCSIQHTADTTQYTQLTHPAPPRIDHQDATNVDEKGIAFTIRSVFIIDSNKKIRTILSYPASTGRNTAEVLRIVDSLQTADKAKIATPINVCSFLLPLRTVLHLGLWRCVLVV